MNDFLKDMDQKLADLLKDVDLSNVIGLANSLDLAFGSSLAFMISVAFLLAAVFIFKMAFAQAEAVRNALSSNLLMRNGDEADEEDDLDAKLASATTVEECLDVYREVDEGNILELTAGKKAIALAESREECEEIADVVSDDPLLMDEVAEKAAGFCSTVEECAQLWEDGDYDRPISKAAICRAADIIRGTA